MSYRITKILLWIGALFFFFESLLHFFGLPLLEHDVIFLSTHDRYIALFALTYVILLILVSCDLKKYKTLFLITMIGILLAILNATWIAFAGGYILFFPVLFLDQSLRFLGFAVLIWYLLTLLSYLLKK